MEWLISALKKPARQTARVSSALLDAILPERCALCLGVDANGYCHDCQSLLPWIDVSCRCCGKPLAEPGICGNCQTRGRRDPALLRELIMPFRYRQPLSRHIHQVKYEDQIHFVPALSRMLVIEVVNHWSVLPDVIVPVPLHPDRQRIRGYNQAALIARESGKLLGIPVDERFLVRTRDTLSQTDLNESERRRNMRDVFAVNTTRRYDSIAVVDDVVTSGATVDSVCQTLSRAGISRVAVWAIAKT